MALEFVIQASSPSMLRELDDLDASLSDAVQAIFPLNTEALILRWNGVCVPLSYKYDFSMMIDDVVGLCSRLSSAGDGQMRIAWPSNTFQSVWDIKWSCRDVEVQAEWTTVVGHTEELLRARPAISIPREEFLAEWVAPLRLVARGLELAGYGVEQIPRIGELQALLAKVSLLGQLYQTGARATL